LKKFAISLEPSKSMSKVQCHWCFFLCHQNKMSTRDKHHVNKKKTNYYSTYKTHPFFLRKLSFFLRKMKIKKVTLLPLSILLLGSFFKVTRAVEQQQQDIGFIDITPNYNNLLATSPFGTSFSNDKECPPCFNCMLPGFECLHFANCSEYDGKCNCPPGFGGNDCKQPCKCLLALFA
jgi:hypothetical protein